MASSHSSQQLGHSDNRADYQAALLRRVHRLLQVAYESLTPSDYQKAEEDDITGDLCKHMKHLTEVAPTDRWMAHFSVHDQDPSNDVSSSKTGKPRKGKRRPKIDVRLGCKHRVPNRGYCIEAKRLYRSDSVSEYLDNEGIGAFILGEYAKDDEHGGMVGYVQTGKVQDWTLKIERRLTKLAHCQENEDGMAWGEIRFVKGPQPCFQSVHLREGGRTITITHVFLDFGR